MPPYFDVLTKIGWVGLGGFVGANARYWLATWIQQKTGTGFPWGTFLINVSGSFVLGFLATLFIERGETPRIQTLRLVFAIGFLGAYTTFSTYEYDNFTLVQSGSLFRAFLNSLGSVVAGFLAVWLGVALARIW